MRFYEFEAKQLLARQRVPVPQGGVAATPDDAERLAREAGGPVVLPHPVSSTARHDRCRSPLSLDEGEGMGVRA